MTEACEIYAEAIGKMDRKIAFPMIVMSDEKQESLYRRAVETVAKSERQSRDVRIARRALKEVAYLKMQSDT
jgi:hypothetical protein